MNRSHQAPKLQITNSIIRWIIITIFISCSISQAGPGNANTGNASPGNTDGCAKSLVSNSKYSNMLMVSKTELYNNTPQVGEELILKAAGEYKIFSSVWFLKLISQNLGYSSTSDNQIQVFNEKSEGEKHLFFLQKIDEIENLFLLKNPVVTSAQKLHQISEMQITEEIFDKQRNFFLMLNNYPELKEYFIYFVQDITPSLLQSFGIINNIIKKQNEINVSTSNSVQATGQFGANVENSFLHPFPAFFFGGAAYALSIHFGLDLFGVATTIPYVVIGGLGGGTFESITEYNKGTNWDNFRKKAPMIGIISKMAKKIIQISSIPFILPKVIVNSSKAGTLERQAKNLQLAIGADIELQIKAITGKSKYLDSSSADKILDGKYISPSADKYYSSMENIIMELDHLLFDSNSSKISLQNQTKITALLSTLLKTISTSQSLANKNEIEAQLEAIDPQNIKMATPKLLRIQWMAAEQREHLEQLASILDTASKFNSTFVFQLKNASESMTSGDLRGQQTLSNDIEFHEKQFAAIIQAQQDLALKGIILFQTIGQKAVLAHSETQHSNSTSRLNIILKEIKTIE